MSPRELSALETLSGWAAGLLTAVAFFAAFGLMRQSDDREIEAMRAAQRAKKEQQRARYADLDKAGRMMTAYDRIGK